MRVRIVGTDLPGKWCHDALAVAVQRKKEFEGVTPADADRATFEFDVRVVGDGTPDDVRGDHVFGRKGDRFFYLAWITPAAGGGWDIVRRAKLRPAAVPGDVWAAAVDGAVLEGALGLTDGRGEPLCASVDRRCTWRAVPA